jgi:peptide deformylase
MILPIVAYGDPVLKRKTVPVSSEHPDIGKLIADMYETMYKASGVGLAAPQIGLSLRLFVADASAFDEPEAAGFRQVFINPEITDRSGDHTSFNEGCLSIPNVREEVKRPDIISIRFYDENFDHHEKQYHGIVARIIQHEYDHLEGKLITDYMSPLKRQIMKKKLTDISRGIVDVDYRMRFPLRKNQ